MRTNKTSHNTLLPKRIRGSWVELSTIEYLTVYEK